MDRKFLFCIILLLVTSTYADIPCWTPEDLYISRYGPQMSKFCSCASGIYGYASYKAFADYAETTQFIDSGDNTNWVKKPKTVEYYPIKYIVCLDGVQYYTNDIHYPSIPTSTTLIPPIISCQQKCIQNEYATWACAFPTPTWAEESMLGDFCPGGETCWCGSASTTTTISPPTTTTLPSTHTETLISEWIYGVSESISAYGNRIYVNAGDVLIVMDSTDPNNPQQIKEIPNAGLTIGGGPQIGQYIVSNDKIIAICQGSRGVTVVDANTFTTAKIEFESSADSAYLNGNTLFLSVGGNLVVVDVTTPQNPVVVSSTDIPCNSMASEGNYLYVVNKDQVDTYDISNPNSPTILSSYPCGGTIWDITVLNDVVYVARHFEETVYHSVHLIDVSNKNLPTGLGTYISPSGNSYKKIAVMNDNYLLVTEHDRFVEIVDTSDKSSPTRVSTVDYTHGYPRDVCRVDDTHFALASHYRGLDMFDFSNPLAVVKINYPVAYGRIKAGTINPDTKIGYLLDDLGLRIIDLNPYHSQQIKYLDFSSRGSDIKLVDDIAYCGVSWGGIKIVGVSDPNNPQMLTDYNPSDYIHNIQIIGNYAYMDHFSSIRLFDITDKTSIVELSSTQSFGKTFWGWAIQGNYLYIANWDEGLLIYDWSDKNHPPVFISKTTCGITKGSGIIVDGNIAYVQDYYYGLRICDVTNKQSPVHIGDYTEYHINPRGAGMEKYGNILYFGTAHGTYALDVSDPTNPLKIRNVGSGSPCSMDGNLLSLCRNAAGFSLYQIGGVIPTTTTTIPTTTTTMITTTTIYPTTTTTLPTPPQPTNIPYVIGILATLLIIGGIMYFKK